jgi:hypothetical protein
MMYTRIAAPPTFSSAVDLILCSKGLALDCTWSVLDDPAGSDHLPIVASLGFFQIPLIFNFTTLIFDLTRHVSWSDSRERVLEALDETPEFLSVGERYALYVNIIHSSALAAQVRSPKMGKQYTLFPVAWWNRESEDSKKVKLVAFREYRNNGIIENYKKYKEAEVSFATVKKRNLCDVFARL